MKLQLLPTTFDERGCATGQQHFACLVIDDCAAIDAGSLATATTQTQKEKIRDVVLTHAHLDHIAGLPLFIDDLFANLREPVRVHATAEVIEVLEKHIFNWKVYPNFCELKNDFGEVLIYKKFAPDETFKVANLDFKAVAVNHKVPSVGFILSDGKTKIAVSGDTAEMDGFWKIVNMEKRLDGLLIECAFPDELSEIAYSSYHLTPKKLKSELEKFAPQDCPIYVINLKPLYREKIIEQLNELKIERLKIFEVGRIYNF